MNPGTECSSKIFPLNSFSCDKNFLACCTNTDSSIMQWKGQKSLKLAPYS